MQKILVGLLILFSLAGCKGRSSAADLYKFATTKDVEVQVNIAFKLDDTSGPLLDVTGKKFILNAFALDAGGRQVAIGIIGKDPIADYPVTMPGANLSFDSIMRVPVEIQPRANGYALRFELREDTTLLRLETSSDDSTLSALRGDIQAGKDPSSNKVTLSLVTTAAARMIRNSLDDPGASPSLTAYDDLINLLTPRLQTVEAAADTSKSQTIAVYASAMAAGLKFQIMTDTALQTQLTDKIATANVNLATDELKSAASVKIASSVSEILVAYAKDVKSRLGDTTTVEYKVFPANSIDVSAVPDSTEYSNAIFAPAAITFTDTDSTAAIGGAATVTAPLVTRGLSSYNIYFGGDDRTTSKISLAGNILASASPLKLTLASGTSVPSGATRLWVYPVTTGTQELDFPSFCILVNVGGSNPAYPAAPTGVATVAAAGKNTTSWNAVSGATSYNLYWSTTSPVTSSSNKIKTATSPYSQQILQKDVTYYYRVTAVKSGLESALSSEASAVAQAATSAAAVPQNLAAAVGDLQNIITWNTFSGATSYDLYWSNSSGVSTSSNKISNVTSPYTHSSLTNGTKYYYALVANTASGATGLSAEVSATPFMPGPGLTTLNVATPTTAKVTLSWTAVAGASSYVIRRGTTAGSTTTLVTSTSSTTYTDTPLINGITYYYSIHAVDASGESRGANELSAKPVWTPTDLYTPSTTDLRANSIATASDGSVYISGNTRESIDGKTMIGRTDMYIAKYSRTGTKLWVKTYGSPSGSNQDLLVAKIVVDSSSNIYIAGTTYGNIASESKIGNQDLWILKLDPDGNQLQIREAGKSGDTLIITGMGLDSSHNIYLLMSRFNAFFPGPTPAADTQIGSQDAVVLKYDSSLNPVWAKHLGLAGKSIEGNYLLVSGSYFYIAGVTDGAFTGNTMAGSSDAYVAKLDTTTGSLVWAAQVGGLDPSNNPDDSYGYDVQMGPSGEIFLAGWTYANVDGNVSADVGNGASFITKVSTTGTKVWTKAFTSATGGLEETQIAPDTLGNVYFTSWSFGGAVGTVQPIGNTDLFVGKLDSSGNVVWKSMYGFVGQDVRDGWVAVDSDGAMCLGAIGPSTLSAGNKAVIITKYSPSGTR